MFWGLILSLPVATWGTYVALKRQASLRSIFAVVGAECLVLAILVALKSP